MIQAKYGAVAAGHPETARAAIEILEAGGNAFDAIVAAAAVACVSEPVLASLGGGGFLTARQAGSNPKVYDFFVQTPINAIPHKDSDFYPIIVDFGVSTQEFHVGTGSVATPGMVKGLFKILDDLGTMPKREVLSPAIDLARQGVELNKLQAYLYSIVSPILLASDSASALFSGHPPDVLKQGEVQYMHDMANLLELLCIEGESLFYRGEVGTAITAQTSIGGHLSATDLEQYKVIIREPHQLRYRDYEIFTNPMPSSGGVLIGFALQLIQGLLTGQQFGSAQHLTALLEIMDLTNKARMDRALSINAANQHLQNLDSTILNQYKEKIISKPYAPRGTTHISVADVSGNHAALTLSNGEGCGNIVSGCGFMLNNMLGEQDLNPNGFGKWQRNTRMTSMMAPGLMRDHKHQQDFVFGSGGSNRIRSAILQVLLNIIEFDQNIESAVTHPRVHYENDTLNVETGFDQAAINSITKLYPNFQIWENQNLYFGGVHTLMVKGKYFGGVGDTRRGGVSLVS